MFVREAGLGIATAAVVGNFDMFTFGNQSDVLRPRNGVDYGGGRQLYARGQSGRTAYLTGTGFDESDCGNCIMLWVA